MKHSWSLTKKQKNITKGIENIFGKAVSKLKPYILSLPKKDRQFAYLYASSFWAYSLAFALMFATIKEEKGGRR